MILWHGVVNAFATPPGLFLLIIAIGLVIALWRRTAGLVVIGAAWAIMTAVSLPIVARALARTIETVPALEYMPTKAQAIVVLAAGRYRDAPEYGGRDTVGPNTLVRVRYAAYLYHQQPLPILVSGGAPSGGTPDAALMRRVLVREFDVPVRYVETRSQTTAQNARFSAAILRRAHIHRILLVTQAWHMQRAVKLFAAQGLTVIPAPTGFATAGRDDATPLRYLPSAHALAISAHVAHEEIGLLWIRLRHVLPHQLAAFINNP